MRAHLAGLVLMLLLAGRLHAQEPAATDPVPAAQAAADAFSQALKAAEKTLGPGDSFTAEIRDSLAALQR